MPFIPDTEPAGRFIPDEELPEEQSLLVQPARSAEELASRRYYQQFPVRTAPIPQGQAPAGLFDPLVRLPRAEPPAFFGQPSTAEQVGAGIYNVAAGAAEAMTSPANLLTLGVAGLAAPVTRGAAALWSVLMGVHLPEQFREAARAIREGTPQEKVEAIGNLGVTGTFAALGGREALRRAPKPNPVTTFEELPPPKPVEAAPETREPVPLTPAPEPEVVPATAAVTELAKPAEAARAPAEPPATETPITEAAKAQPEFATRFDRETLLAKPDWVQVGSAFDKALSAVRENPERGRDITGIWKTITPDQRQDLISRGWVVRDTRTPGQVVLGISNDAIAARKYFAAQTTQALREASTTPEPAQVTAAEAKAPEVTPEPAAPERLAFPGVGSLSEKQATPLELGKIKANDPELWKAITQHFKTDKPGQIAKLARERFAAIRVSEPPQSMGPGAAARAEFEEAAKESGGGIFTRLADWIKSRQIPDDPRIQERIKERDVMAGRQWLNSPEYLFRKDPVAAPFVSRIIESQLRYSDRAGRDEIHFKELTKGLPKSDLERITKALRDFEQGDQQAFAILTPEEAAVASDIRGYFDQWKTRLRERKVERIIAALPEARANALRMVQEGASLADAAKANKLKTSGREAVQMALNEIAEAQKWGIENYVTHAEQGDWRIVTEDGTTVAIAESKIEAYEKAQKFLEDNPGQTLTLDDSFDPGVDWPSQLTPPAYGKLLKQLREATGAAAKDLQDALRKTAPGIVVKPTQKYSRFLLKRRDILAGEENIMDVLPSYIYSMWKKHELDPVLREGRSTLPKLGPETRDAVEGLLADVKGRKYLGDKVVDHVLSGAADLVEKKSGFSIPVKPFAYSRGVNVLRNISAHLKLGYRPIAILINRLGGIHHTWTKTGFSDLMEGRRWIKSPEGQELVKANEAEMGLQAAFVTEGRLSPEEPWYKPLGLFQKMEHFNRPEAFGAFYIQATKRLGLTGQDAIQYARNATRFAQFTYNTAALPKIMRGPTGRLLFQFKPYLVKEVEFLSTLKPAEFARYMTGFLTLGGPRAAIMVLRSLPVLGAIGLIGTLEDWLNQNAPRATRGAPGFAGVDVSASAAPQLPSTARDWAGPVLSDYVALWNTVVKPALQGESKGWNDIKEWGTRISPALFYMDQAVESAMNEQGWVTDARGRKQFQPELWDKAKLALGMMPLQKSIDRTEERYLLETEAIQRKNRQHWLDKVVDSIQNNDEDGLGSLLEDVGEYYADHKSFQTALENNMKQRAMTPRERLFQRLSKTTRIREQGRFIPDE